MLRRLADDIERSEVKPERVTLITGFSVYCYGPASDERATEQAVLDMTWGIHHLMAMARDSLDGDSA
jgi:hypothetical protein